MALQKEQTLVCPACGQKSVLEVELSEGKNQFFVLDCPTCCKPLEIEIHLEEGEIISFSAKPEGR